MPPGAALAAAWLLILTGCSNRAETGYQGYVEGEFVNVATSAAGRLDALFVKRGDEIVVNTPLYALDAVDATAAERLAREQVKTADAHLADMRLGKRPQEIDAAQAQLAQVQADLQKTATQLARDEAQFKVGGIPRQQLDDSRAAQAAAAAHVRQLQSELEVARLPSRSDQLKAQEAQVAAAHASLEQAAWRLGQTAVVATQAGRVFDTLYRQGEWVAAGSPVVRMLPPQNIKVRFFVAEPALGGIALGRAATILCDGCGSGVPATLTYISTEAEYTPPIIYSNETRSKLVFMIEARPKPEDAVRLHPGQPVSVRLP
jgi:HlyD family secretion protein